MAQRGGSVYGCPLGGAYLFSENYVSSLLIPQRIMAWYGTAIHAAKEAIKDQVLLEPHGGISKLTQHHIKNILFIVLVL